MLDQTLALARITLSDPKQAARLVLMTPLHRTVLTEAMALVAILGVLVTMAAQWIAPVEDILLPGLLTNPVLMAVIQLALLFLSVLGVYLVGRMFGGTGGFDDTLQAMVWLQFVVVLIQAVEVPIYLFSIELAGIVSFLTAIFATWLTINFIAVIHGFQSLMKVLMGFLGVSFVLGFVLIFAVGVFVGVTKGV